MENRILIPIGGNEKKSKNSEIFREIVRRGGGRKARIVIIPIASLTPEARGEVYRKLFESFFPEEIHVLSLEQRDDAANPDNLKIVENGSVIMFSGGDQLRITSKLGGTPLEKLLKEKYESGCVIAGTSAGAAAIPRIMIYQTNNFRVYRKGGLEITQGLGFISDVIFDTHFVKRSRISRLIHAVATNPGLLGFGIEENTALVIENEEIAHCIGSATIIVVDGKDAEVDDIGQIETGKPFAISNLRYSVLTSGLAFDLAKRRAFLPERATILPILKEAKE